MKTLFNRRATGALVALGALALPGAAAAQQMAETTTSLHLRTGPGVGYEVATTMPAGAEVALGGCEANGRWCQVSWQDFNGWASSRYLSASREGETMMLSRGFDLFPTVEFTGDTAMMDVETSGAMTAPAGTAPPQRVGNYVGANPTDMRYVDGEVVVGARLPRSIPLEAVPNYRDDYTYVNGRIVMVDPRTRAITYVYG